MSDKLRECPFCGGEAKWINPNYTIGNIFCKECGTSTQTMHITMAIKVWNTRAKSDKHVLREKILSEDEICICAAIKCNDGTIVRGNRHGDCYITAKAMKKKLSRDQGFITSKNRYVRRKEACILQNKAGIKSIWSGKEIKKILFSEDLY